MRCGVMIVLVLLIGCAGGGDFLGYPENRARRLEEENPRIDDALRDTVTMTEVRAADYASYLRLKEAGKIYREMHKDGFVYYAVRSQIHSPLPPERPTSPAEAYITVIERYKARIPQE